MANITETYLIDHFYEALEKKQIQAYFQPIFRSLTRKVFCAETLARWVDPEMGMIVPADFIPVLEKSRLICDLEESDGHHREHSEKIFRQEFLGYPRE